MVMIMQGNDIWGRCFKGKSFWEFGCARAAIINKLMTQEGASYPHQLRTLCGPFDQQFKRKFLGSRSTSFVASRAKLTSPAPLPLAFAPNLLPKIKQIEKIAHLGGRRAGKKKQGEVISELQLYLTKKVASNQSTKDLITRMEATTLKHAESTRKYSQSSSKFYPTEGVASMTGYSEGRTGWYKQGRKWITDDQFRQKFDRFVLKHHDQEEAPKVSDLFGNAQTESAEHIRSKIEADRGALKEIIRKMIDRHNQETEGEEPLGVEVLPVEGQTDGQERRNIQWVIQKCQELQGSTLKKASKSTKRL